MSKKFMALLGILTLGIGGATTIALQTHAQSIASPAPVVSSTHVKTSGDTDNVQNDNSAIDQPDSPDSSSVSSQKDTKEQGESDTANGPEVEDAN